LKQLRIFDFHRRRVDPTYHEISGKQRPFSPKEFPEDALESVTVDRPPYLSCDKNSKRKIDVRFPFDENVNVRQGKFSGQWKFGEIWGKLGKLFFGDRYGEALTPFRAATLQDFSSARRSHAFTKTMRPQTPFLVGLEGSLHV